MVPTGDARPPRARPRASDAGRGAPLRIRLMAHVRIRLTRLRLAALLIAQAVSATSASWALVRVLVPGRVAVFAPIAALITLTISMTQRLRRVIELILGVALGVFVGDLLVAATGTGVWQLALIVSISMITAILIGGGPTFTVQAAATGIIIATVTPVTDLLFSRVFDVLIGAAVGLAVSTVLLPVNPVMIARREANRMLTELADALHELGAALRYRSDSHMQASSNMVRAVETTLAEFTQVIGTATETARLAPFRWRVQDRVRPYLLMEQQIGGVVRNLRVLSRRSRALLNRHEDVPVGVPEALDGLARAARHLLADLAADRTPHQAQAEVMWACRETADVQEGLSISGQVIVAQIRSTAVDLLRSTGLGYADADRAVRGAVTEPRLRRDQTL